MLAVCEKLSAAASLNFYPYFLSELAHELNTKVVPNFVIYMFTKLQLKRMCTAGDIRKIERLCFLKNQKTRGGVIEFFD